MTQSATTPWLRLAFRPLFLMSGAFACVAMVLWMVFLLGHVDFRPYGGAYFWHAHEMVFGFVLAVVAGFLLTAVQNWTGLRGVHGYPLLMIVLLWLAGRIMMLIDQPPWITAAPDILFLLAVTILLARPILKVRQYRNLVFVPVLLLMAAGNVLAHHGMESGDVALGFQGIYLAGWLVVFVMTVLGGRILPMFTANGTGTPRVANLPWLERGVIAGTLLLVLIQGTGLSDQLPDFVNGLLALLVAILHGLRLGRLPFRATLRVPLLWSLHLAFWWLPALFVLLAWHYLAPSRVLPLPESTAMHALFAGAMGNMILAMMARVSLGHTGRPLQAAPVMSWAFGAVFTAAVFRVIGVWLWPAASTLWVALAAALWLLAYGIFLVVYSPILTQPRVDGKMG